jgi:hypothetical protein
MMARILERETGRKAMSLAHVEAVEVFVSAESRTDPHGTCHELIGLCQ